ncbi:MAG: aldo/keto reductase [Bacteroidota bacterium]
MMVDTLSPYVYGTTRLGDESIPEQERIQTALEVMNQDIWIHTCHKYGDSLDILRKAFEQEPTKIPNIIMKIWGGTKQELIDGVKVNLDRMGVDSLDMGQLCIGGEFAESLAEGGDAVQVLQEIRESGLIKSFVYEVFPWTSELPLKALQNGSLEGIIDAFIFYLNPLQRFAANELWDEIQKTQFPIVALRTVSGGPVHKLRDIPGFAWVKYLQERAVEVAPIFEKSGVPTWTEFCVRYAYSFPNLKATTGSTSKIERVHEFLKAIENVQPLPQDIMDEIAALQYRWSDEVDVKAEPWTM